MEKIKKNAKKIIFKTTRIILGILLLILGIAGLLLPFFPGVFLIVLGLVLLNNDRLKNLISKIFLRLKKH